MPYYVIPQKKPQYPVKNIGVLDSKYMATL